MAKGKGIRLAHDKYLAPLVAGTGGAVVANQLPQNQKSSKKKVEQVFKSDSEFATRMYNMVMKMDEDEARYFTEMVVWDVLNETIEKNQRTLQRHLNDVVNKRIERLKRATVSAVSKGANEEAVEFAKALALIEKKSRNQYDFGAHFEESDYRRDPSTGRFRTKVRVNPSKPALSAKQQEGIGIPHPNEPKGYKLSPEDRAQYQQEYQQIANFLSAVQMGGNLGDHDVVMQVQNKNNGQRHQVLLNKKPVAGRDGDWDPRHEQVIGLAARPSGLNIGGAAFALSNSFGRPMSQDGIQTLKDIDTRFPAFSRDWNDDSDPYNSNSRLYSNVKTGGEFLSNVAPDGSKAQVAGEFARFVGQHGGEAEQVFGPAIRRSAYRYRGVERTPDPELVQQFNAARRNVRGTGPTPEQTKERTTQFNRAVRRKIKEKAAETNTPEDAVELTRAERAQLMQSLPAAGTGPDAAEVTNAGREAVHDYMSQRVERLEQNLYNLHLSAGNTPPSEGVLLDKNGNIVTQAIGYGDDHYLPFNLRNLKALRGGEYIRTRSVGGPTSEDIYTGLLTGARRIQVVSRSGTFTIDFNEDFKGGRRYNDKAARMVKRYQQILDSVQSEKVDAQQVPNSIRQMITAQVRDKAEGWGPAETRAEITRKLEEFKSNPDFDEVALDREISAFTQDMPDGERRMRTAQLHSDAKKAREFKFKLNGEGYGSALKTLEEQFPYYMTTDYKPRKEEDKFESEKDRGYVEPGRNRPTSAEAGFYGTKINEGKKFSASHADYQRGKYGTGSRPAKREADQIESKKGELTATGEKKTSIGAKVEEVRNQDKFVDAALGVANELRPALATSTDQNVKRQYSMLLLPDEELREQVKDPVKAKRFEEQYALFRKENPDVSISDDVRTAYDRASGRIGRKPYEHAAALLNPKKPFWFDDDAYKENAKQADIDQEQEKLDKYRPASQPDKKLSAFSPGELDTEIDMLSKISKVAAQFRDGMSMDDKIELLERDGLPGKGRAAELARDPNLLKKDLKTVHKQKALNLNKGSSKPKPAEEPKDEELHLPANKKGGEGDFTEKMQGLHGQLSHYRDNLKQRGKQVPEHLDRAIYDADIALNTGRPVTEQEWEGLYGSEDYQRSIQELMKDMHERPTARDNW